jgi:hypothetical protein
MRWINKNEQFAIMLFIALVYSLMIGESLLPKIVMGGLVILTMLLWKLDKL